MQQPSLLDYRAPGSRKGMAVIWTVFWDHFGRQSVHAVMHRILEQAYHKVAPGVGIDK